MDLPADVVLRQSSWTLAISEEEMMAEASSSEEESRAAMRLGAGKWEVRKGCGGAR